MAGLRKQIRFRRLQFRSICKTYSDLTVSDSISIQRQLYSPGQQTISRFLNLPGYSLGFFGYTECISAKCCFSSIIAEMLSRF